MALPVVGVLSDFLDNLGLVQRLDCHYFIFNTLSVPSFPLILRVPTLFSSKDA